MNVENKALYILAYLFALISGIIVYLLSSGNERLRFHAKQAIIIGIIIIIMSFIPLINYFTVIPWIYGLYLGIKAYNGKDISIIGMKTYAPTQTPPAKQMDLAKVQTPKTKIKRRNVDIDENASKAVEALKLRYAKGEITKKEYNKIKKDLEM